MPFINDGFSKHPLPTHRLLLVAPTKGYHIIAQDWVLWPATCWFCVLKSNLCFCQMFVCPTNCDHVGLLGCSSTIIILILWILCVLVRTMQILPGMHLIPQKRSSSLTITIICCSCLLFPSSVSDDVLLAGIQFAFAQVFAGG